MKLVTILGTRPEIIRLSECIKLADKVFDHTLIHTGQNYDYELNEIFFSDLDVRKPDHFLSVAGAHLGETIGNVISKSYELLLELKPDAVLVLGDTNSVLATIAAKRLKIPIFHMEAGNRCFDQNVPEETNRKISDHISDVNLCYTENSRRYLLSEGFRKDHVFVTGSPLMEVLNVHQERIKNSEVLQKYGLQKQQYIVVSMHREENIDIPAHFQSLVGAINSVAEKYGLPILFSTHPRTRKKIEEIGAEFHEKVILTKPLGFFDYVHLQANSKIVLSDSGTISEESAMMGFPSISMRTSTERPEAIDAGTVVVSGITSQRIMEAIEVVLNTHQDWSFDDITSEYKVTNTSMRVIRAIQGFTDIINRVTWAK